MIARIGPARNSYLDGVALPLTFLRRRSNARNSAIADTSSSEMQPAGLCKTLTTQLLFEQRKWMRVCLMQSAAEEGLNLK